MLPPHFLSPTGALEPSSCLVMNLLCIVSNFDIQVWASRSHSKGCFSCPKKKKMKCPYLKIMFWKRHLGATTSFFEPHRGLKPSSCIVRNLLCIRSDFDIQVWASRSSSKGGFWCPKKKNFKCPYLKIAFSTKMSFTQNTADLWFSSQIVLSAVSGWIGNR